MKFKDVQNLDELVKIAIPQDLREEFHPDQASKETGEENVFPASALFVEVIIPLDDLIKRFEESKMLPDEFLDKLTNVQNELSRIWLQTKNFTEGMGLQREETKSMTLPA